MDAVEDAQETKQETVVMTLPVELWRYEYWEALRDIINGETLTQANFQGDGRVNHQDSFFRIDDQGYSEEWVCPKHNLKHYVKMVKGNTYYLLPQMFLDKLPAKPLQTMDTRLRKSDAMVWKFITEVQSLQLPAKRFLCYKETINNWNPMQSTDDRSWTFLKIVAMSRGNRFAICGGVGSGKNANIHIMSAITSKYARIAKPPTPAKMYRDLYNNDFINIDEITSWQKSKAIDIEDMAAEIADDSPNMNKFSLDRNRLLEVVKLDGKSWVYTFNPVSDQNPNTFADKFANADKILDRYPIFNIKGKITNNIIKPYRDQATSVVNDNFQTYGRIVANAMYWLNHVQDHLNGWDRSKLKLERRHKNNTHDLINRIDAYCDSQIEFDSWVEWLNISLAK